MTRKGNSYTVTIKPSHLNWGTYRNPTNRPIIEGESYVKIPSSVARRLELVSGERFVAHFTNDMEVLEIKAAGNGPLVNSVQYAKQFEGVGSGACKAFTPWYTKYGAEVGDKVLVEFLSEHDIQFTIMKVN